MRENVDILGVFHDGTIVEIMGVLPNITFRIEIEYLRNMFPTKGVSFFAVLSGCESIEFYNWESNARTTVLSEIQDEEPEILSIEQQGEAAHIICSTGELDVLYKEIEFELDSGEAVTYKELDEACNKYWDEWESRANS